MSALPVYVSQIKKLKLERSPAKQTFSCGQLHAERFVLHGDILHIGIDETFVLDGKVFSGHSFHLI